MAIRRILKERPLLKRFMKQRVEEGRESEYITCGDSYDAERLRNFLIRVRDDYYKILDVSLVSDVTVKIDYLKTK